MQYAIDSFGVEPLAAHSFPNAKDHPDAPNAFLVVFDEDGRPVGNIGIISRN